MLKTDINNISEQEFKPIVIRLLAIIEKNTQDTRGTFITEIKDLKNSQAEIKML